MESKKTAIEAKAHELWVQRGKPIGDPMTDWVAAEKIVNGGPSSPKISKRQRRQGQ